MTWIISAQISLAKPKGNEVRTNTLPPEVDNTLGMGMSCYSFCQAVVLIVRFCETLGKVELSGLIDINET